MDTEISRKVSNARTMFDGCLMEYGNAIEDGRLTTWAAMVHSIVDWLAANQEPTPPKESP